MHSTQHPQSCTHAQKQQGTHCSTAHSAHAAQLSQPNIFGAIPFMRSASFP